MEDLTLFEALTGAAFDHLNWQHSREWYQKKIAGGGMGGSGINRYITCKKKKKLVSSLSLFVLIRYSIVM